MVQITQPLAVQRYLGLIGEAEARDVLIAKPMARPFATAKPTHWGDSSNKLSWLIPDLAALFPEARFVHLVRDGRKVASSYFHKLGDECYDDRSTAILQAHYDDPDTHPAPPPEKKYWWPLPRRGSGDAAPLSRLQPVRAHLLALGGDQPRDRWKNLSQLPPERTCLCGWKIFARSPVRGAQRFIDFLEPCLAATRTYGVFARPHNVNRPEDQPARSHAARAIRRDRRRHAWRGSATPDSPEYVVNY